MDHIGVMDLFAYYLSEYDTKAVGSLGFQTQSQTFDTIAPLFDKKSSYLRRLRDEYDVVTNSARKGQRNRPPRDRINRVSKYLSVFSFAEITEILQSFLDNKAAQSDIETLPPEDDTLPLMSEDDVEHIINFHDDRSMLRIKAGNNAVRVYNAMIIRQLKKLYNGCCQICGKNAFDEFGVDICEAHHIIYFSQSQNNDSSNIIILCPNHHRLLHKLNSVFVAEEGYFDLGQGKKLKVILDLHLT